MLHPFTQPIAHIALPEAFTCPFHYTPHPLCILAAEDVKLYLASREEWQEELQQGKMFGVLVVKNQKGKTGYLAAYSGNIGVFGERRSIGNDSFFVPPVYDLSQPDGFFKVEEAAISAINERIREMEKSGPFRELQQELEEATEAAKNTLAEAKEALKTAKKKREKRRKELQGKRENQEVNQEEYSLNEVKKALLERGFPLNEENYFLNETEQAALIRESQFQKAEYKRLERSWKERIGRLQTEVTYIVSQIEELKRERKSRSAALQQKLFSQFRLLNARGEVKDLCTLFEQTAQKTPPAGAGECAAPRLLQYAYMHGLHPVAMAEFWWGDSPKTEIRKHGYYYPACKAKCEPILNHMLQGLNVAPNPLHVDLHRETEPEIVYEDAYLLVINKPEGMLTVPGKENVTSVYIWLKKKYPAATGPLIVHRLDMATSGLLLVAKNSEVHRRLQAQFEERTIKKRYVALLDITQQVEIKEQLSDVRQPGASKCQQGDLDDRRQRDCFILPDKGIINLPLCPNPFDRPRQIVDEEHGKPAITKYEILERTATHIRIAFYPLTGRTHQLRVHSAHPLGLNLPILGDELYGRKSGRLYLHAEYLEFEHPANGERMRIEKKADF